MLPVNYYQETMNVSDAREVEIELQQHLDRPINSLDDLETWIEAESLLLDRLSEVMAGHLVDFYRDTENDEKRDIYLHDQTQITPLITKYQAKFNEKFSTCPFTCALDDSKYGLMKRVKRTELKLYREENLPLESRERELTTEYQTLVSSQTVDWNGTPTPRPTVQAYVDSPNGDIRRQAWSNIAEVDALIKDEVDSIMDELIQIRHQIAQNAGFENYRDYAFCQKHREFSIEYNLKFHAAVEKYIVPVWDDIAADLKRELDVDAFRPWDNSNNTLANPPYETIEQLTDGVGRILEQFDARFGALFSSMQDKGLLDLGGRKGKSPGGFYCPFPISQHGRVFANMSPSFFSLIALIHEMGHAVNYHFQLQMGSRWRHSRMEVAELFSHGMELLALDKFDAFYKSPEGARSAVRLHLRRSLTMLLNPLSGDVFQHWLYTNPNHTRSERDQAFYNIRKRYSWHPIEDNGYEEQLATSWISSVHFVETPFYNIEYSTAELGALQLLKNYGVNAQDAIEAYNRGASADMASLSIAEIYREANVDFDFSDESVQAIANMVKELWTESASQVSPT